MLPGSDRYDEDHEAFRDSARRFLAARVVPHLDEFRAGGTFPRELITDLGAEGFLGMSVPEEHGGGGVEDPRFAAVLLQETMSIGAAGLAKVLAQHLAGTAALLRQPAAAPAWLEGAASGRLLVVPLVADAGGRAAGVPGGALGDVFVIVGDGVGALGGNEVTRTPVAGLGGRESAMADVAVDLARVQLTGDPSELLAELDVWAAVLAVAGARAAFDVTSDYVRQRKAFGQPIASFENTRFRLAELGSQIAAAQALSELCLDALAGSAWESTTAAAARLVALDAHDRAVDQGMQLHGGYGYMREYPIAHAFSDARFLRTAAQATGDRRPALAAAFGL